MRLAAVVWLLAAAPTALAQATRPDQSGHISGEALGKLTRLAAKLNLFRWGDPIVISYDKPPEKEKWAGVMQAKTKIADGKLVITPQRKNSYFAAYRSLPAELADSPGVRIEADLSLDDLGNIPRAGIFIGSNGQGLFAWEYQYYFAYTQNGRLQRLQVQGQVNQNAAGDAIPAKKSFHVTLQIAGPRIDAQRGKSKLAWAGPAPMTLKPGMVFGFTGRVSALRVSRLTFRPLVRVAPAQDKEHLWADLPFADERELNAYLKREVIPRLGDEAWARRAEATRLLADLMPLSRSSVRQSLEQAISPEVRLRLQIIDQGPTTYKILPIPDDEPEPAPKGPTSQPDDPAAKPPAPEKPPAVRARPIRARPVLVHPGQGG